MERWSVAFFSQVSWQWDKKFLVRLGSVIEHKRVEVESTADKSGLPIIEKISFGGLLSLTEPKTRQGYKGRLFWADAGDLVYSKIRVKQGSLALVPAELGRIAVSAEYPVYRILETKAVPEYLALLLKSRTFLSLFEGLSHGGSSKTRIPPDEFERQIIPLPPPAEQRAIVERWRSAHVKIAAASVRVKKLDANLSAGFLRELGLQAGKSAFTAKAFALRWEELERWSIGYIRQASQGLIPESGKHPVVRLREVIADLENGWSPKCFERPAHNDEWGVLKLGAVSFGAFNENENKGLPPNLQPVSALEVKPGDVLISRANVPRYVGACALVRTTRPRLMLCDKIFRVVFKQNSPIDGGYLAEVMKIPHLRRQIETAVTGSSPTMQNITKSALLGLHLPLPPLGVQRKLVERVTAARAEMARERAAAAQLRQTIAADVESLILGTQPPRS